MYVPKKVGQEPHIIIIVNVVVIICWSNERLWRELQRQAQHEYVLIHMICIQRPNWILIIIWGFKGLTVGGIEHSLKTKFSFCPEESRYGLVECARCMYSHVIHTCRKNLPRTEYTRRYMICRVMIHIIQSASLRELRV